MKFLNNRDITSALKPLQKGMVYSVCVFTHVFVHLYINETKHAERPLLNDIRADGVLQRERMGE